MNNKVSSNLVDTSEVKQGFFNYKLTNSLKLVVVIRLE